MVIAHSHRVLGSPLASILSSMLSSVVVMVIITIAVSVVPVAVGWIVVPMPGLGSLVFWRAIAVRILLRVVRILVWSGRRTSEVSPVSGISLSPVPVPLSGVRWWVALVPVLLSMPVVVLSVFGSVGVTARVGPVVTSVIHDVTQDQPALATECYL